MAILQDQTQVLQAQLEALRAENERLKAKAMSRQTITFKVSAEKGCLSVYGLGRFPVTLYGGQWLRLAKAIPDLVAFIEENRDSMSWKD
jgi:hypothetical protein